MGRSGYDDGGDYDSWDAIRWRGAVLAAIRGKRGQAFLREMLMALDIMPEKQLINEDLERSDGAVCALGSVGKIRSLNMSDLDPYDYEIIAKQFGIARSLAQEIMWENDEAVYYKYETPKQRFTRMRSWVVSKIAMKI